MHNIVFSLFFFYLQNYCGVANLVDRYLGNLYPYYKDHTRNVLVRQARDILVCTYHGNLECFEHEFLSPTAILVEQIKMKCSSGSVSFVAFYFYFFVLIIRLYKYNSHEFIKLFLSHFLYVDVE